MPGARYSIWSGMKRIACKFLQGRSFGSVDRPLSALGASSLARQIAGLRVARGHLVG